MKLVMTLLVRDEQDILETNIEYHLARGVDFIIATDNLSVDDTRDILEGYRSKGLLHLIVEPGDNYAQYKWVTRMARLAQAEFGADWVINSDADEFWWPESAADLKEMLRSMPPRAQAISADRYNFVPRPCSASAPFFETMTIRETRSMNALGRPLPPKVCHRAFSDVEVEQGNHKVRRSAIAIKPVTAPLGILHFPLRSYTQFENKIALGGAAYARNAELPATMGRVWRMLHGQYRRGELPEYYQSQELDDTQVDEGVAAGRLVKDTRLRDFIQHRALVGARL